MGAKLHAAGIIVKDASDPIAPLDGSPAELVRRGPGERLYSPGMRLIDLATSRDYFLARDAPQVLR